MNVWVFLYPKNTVFVLHLLSDCLHIALLRCVTQYNQANFFPLLCLSGGVCKLLLPDVASLHQPEPSGPGRPCRPPEPSSDQPNALGSEPCGFHQCTGQLALQSPSAGYCTVLDTELYPPQEQASWVCQCEDHVVQQLEQDFKTTLQQQNSLEQWATWLDGVVSQVLKPFENNAAALPKAAKVFLLNWSFYR